VFAVVGALGAGAAGRAGTADQAEAAAVARAPAPVQYNIVPLSDERRAFGGRINARVQVLLTEQFELSNLSPDRARFYDGRTTRTISPPDITSLGTALNDLGQATVNADDRGFRWSRESGLLALSPPGTGSSALDINNRGEVAGTRSFPANPTAGHAALWGPRAPARDLGTLGGAFSEARAINDAGVVAGLSDSAAGTRPFRWTRFGGMRPLGAFADPTARANDVNAAGDIVGAVPFRRGGPVHAFLWTPGRGLLDLDPAGAGSSAATRVNDRGMVIGRIPDSFESPHGFVWTRETGLLRLSRLAPYSEATDLNNAGQVVGNVWNGGFRPFLWSRATGSIDLNTRARNAPQGLVLSEAHAIDDAGEIVAKTNTGMVLLTTRPVSDVRPLLGPIQQPSDPRAGVLLSFSAGFTDADPRDTHTATWDWGDGGASQGIVNERNGRGIVSGQHVYESEGFEYTVVLTVTDSRGKRSSTRWDLIVLPAPDFIAGQGSVASPPGAAGAAGGRPGIARFAFVSPPAKDAQAAGRARVRFDTPGMRFRSSKIDSLEAQGLQVRYRGSGSLNGKPGYQFMLAADRGADAARKVERVHVRI